MNAPVKAYLETETKKKINFLFNPDTLTVVRAISWTPKDAPGKNAPTMEYLSGQSATMSFKLVIDTTDTGEDVTAYTNELLDLTDVNKSKKRPLWVKLGWGKLKSFPMVVTSVNLTFTYFAANGKPLRASAQMSLTQFKDDRTYPLQNPTSGTRSRERLHEVQPGETLDRISYAAYGDATQWRLIARRNQILDPLSLRAGMRIVLPEQEAVSRGS